MAKEETDTDTLYWPEFETLGNGDSNMSPHRPDSDMPTPPPGGNPLGGTGSGSGEYEWKKGVWNALRDMKKSVDSQTGQITQLLIATKGAVNELDLNKTAQAVRELMYKELKEMEEKHEKEMAKRDAKITALQEFRIRIWTSVCLINALLGLALAAVAIFKK